MPDSDEKNCFDVLRLFLAGLVVYSHACILGGFGDEAFERFTRGQVEAGGFAVIAFFGISGFLISRSYDLRPKPWAFVRARALRILPGFYFSLIVTAFVLAPLIAWSNEAGGRWHWADAGRYVTHNLSVKVFDWSVGGTLSGLPYEGSINGAHWSLFPELLCYAGVLLLGVLGVLWSRSLGLFVVVLLGMHATTTLLPQSGDVFTPTAFFLLKWKAFLVSFFVGAWIYTARAQLVLGGKGALFWGGLLGLILKFGGWQLWGPILVPLAVLNLAFTLRWRLSVDLSYGLYVLHFPVLQLLASTPLRNQGFVLFFTTGLALALALALVSWVCVEKPFLKLKPRTPPKPGLPA